MDNQNNQQLLQLAPGKENLSIFEYVSTRYDAKIPIGVKPEALLDPAFWAHHAIGLKPMDEIRARAEDGTWTAELIVLDCSRTWAKVKQLHLHRLTTADQSLTQASSTELKAFIDGHHVVHRGPHKWSVVRKSDKAVLQEGLGVRDEANQWLETHARAQVGAPAGAKVDTVAA